MPDWAYKLHFDTVLQMQIIHNDLLHVLQIILELPWKVQVQDCWHCRPVEVYGRGKLLTATYICKIANTQ